MGDLPVSMLVEALDRVRVRLEVAQDRRGLRALLFMSDDELVLLAEAELRAAA